MMIKSMPLISLFFVFIVLTFMFPFFICPVQADGDSHDINLTDIPIRLAEGLNIDTFSGKILCSIILLLICVLPISMIVRSKYSSWIPEIAITLCIMGFCVSIQWLPVWLFLVLCLIIGLMFAGKMRGFITGGKE